MSRSWDAGTYHRIDTPMRRWAEALLDDLELRGDEVVLDAGCGSGVVTALLAARLPRGRIHAVDSSPEMIAELERTIAGADLARVAARLGDLCTIRLPELVEVVFSNAVFHWIADFDALVANLAAATRPGGRMRAQCGGEGNLRRLLAAASRVKRRPDFAPHFTHQRPHVFFRGVAETEAALLRAGWEPRRVWLEPAPADLGDRAETLRYLRTVILRVDVAELPDEPTRERYLEAVYDAMVAAHGRPFVADYQRLNIEAHRGSS